MPKEAAWLWSAGRWHERGVKGIEIEMLGIRLMYKKAVLIQSTMFPDRVIYYNWGGLETTQPPFWFAGLPHAVYGKGLLLDLDKNLQPISTLHTVKDVECLVRFRS